MYTLKDLSKLTKADRVLSLKLVTRDNFFVSGDPILFLEVEDEYFKKEVGSFRKAFERYPESFNYSEELGELYKKKETCITLKGDTDNQSLYGSMFEFGRISNISCFLVEKNKIIAFHWVEGKDSDLKFISSKRIISQLYEI